MSAVPKPAPRGACPGALRPMQSGDGLIVRVRPHAGAIPVQSLLALAEAADRYGNGEIDLTRRANLQLRGLLAETLAPVQRALDRMHLLDASPEAEAIRNILVSPLSGHDPDEQIDVRRIARDLELRLARDERLWTLAPKFGFLIDGGGRLSLDGERADIRLRAIDNGSFAVGLDRTQGVHWLGRIEAGKAAAATARAADIFAAGAEAGARMRMRDAGDGLVAAIASELALAPLAGAPAVRPVDRTLGLLDLAEKGVAIAVGLPFGRITSVAAHALALSAQSNGATEVFLSSWRTLYIPLASRDPARAVLATAARHDLVTRDGDPIFRIDACPGAPACASAATATRSAARRLAPLLPALGLRSAHVSGCSKGCARSDPADLVLVASGEGFAILRNGRADDVPVARVSRSLDDLAARLEELAHG
jgi:precorrin-3B synthase